MSAPRRRRHHFSPREWPRSGARPHLHRRPQPGTGSLAPQVAVQRGSVLTEEHEGKSHKIENTHLPPNPPPGFRDFMLKSRLPSSATHTRAFTLGCLPSRDIPSPRAPTCGSGAKGTKAPSPRGAGRSCGEGQAGLRGDLREAFPSLSLRGPGRAGPAHPASCGRKVN